MSAAVAVVADAHHALAAVHVDPDDPGIPCLAVLATASATTWQAAIAADSRSRLHPQISHIGAIPPKIRSAESARRAIAAHGPPVVIADADVTALADEVTLLLRQAADGPERSGLLRFRVSRPPPPVTSVVAVPRPGS
jgi:hypothetical protein